MLSESTRRKGFTLIELLVVISIIAILAGMLLPAINMVKASAQKTNCGSNQKQLHLAMMTYKTDNDDLWPVRPSAAAGTFLAPTGNTDASNLSGFGTTMATFEYLSAVNGGELTPKLFGCPSNATNRPSANASSSVAYATGTSQWAADGVTKSSFGYDWGAPANATAQRAVLADRPITATTTNHKNVAMVAYSDGHIGNITLVTGTPGAVAILTSASGGATVTTAIAPNKDSSSEDIYSDDAVTGVGGTAAATQALGNGPTTVSFIR